MADLWAWLDETERLRATRVVDVPGGVAVRHDEYPLAHDHNKLVITSPADPAAVVAAADRVLADVSHRLVEVMPSELAEGWELPGWSRGTNLVMVLDGTHTADERVSVVSLEQRQAAASRSWQWELPDAHPEVWRQLGTRAVTMLSAADCTWLGVVVDGAVVARTDLYVRDGVAQVENVWTDADHRGRGYAAALVRTAASLAPAGSQVFLVADGDDWPQELYRRLGFTDAGTAATFTRLPAA